MAILEAVKDMSGDDGDGWIIYRCPHCNAWDYALQGLPRMTDLGIYDCEECGEKFEIK